MRYTLLLGLGVFILHAVTITPNVSAQKIDRLTVGYDLMFINRIRFNDGSSASVPGLYRNSLQLNLKKGPIRLGLVYQIARGEGFDAHADEGLMITSSYEHILSYSMKAMVLTRVGISRGVDFGNILYPTDTDISAQIGYFNPDGRGFFMDYPLFPSTYAGLIVNRFGRVQFIAGAGTFWRGLNLYVTGYYSVNGVSNILDPPESQVDIAFAFLNNSGVNASLGIYVLDSFISIRHNFPIFNSGNDWVFSLEHTFHFE